MDWEPQEFSAPARAFPTTVKGYMPEWDDLPEPFGNANNHDHQACELAQRLAAGPEIPAGVEFHPVEGIGAEMAFHHIMYLLGSWEPKHEHKIGGVGYLISIWFKAVIVPNEDGEDEVLWQQPTSS